MIVNLSEKCYNKLIGVDALCRGRISENLITYQPTIGVVEGACTPYTARFYL